jgi:DNA (cytosine-5)-methyltransferase 1
MYILGEMFSGPGGFALGAQMAQLGNLRQIRNGFAIDYDKSSTQTYKHNFPNHYVINDDVKNVDPEFLPYIDAFAFGFPCNDFSNAGKKEGLDGNFGSLYKYGINIIKFFKPKWFVAENVSGLSSANEGKAFNQILNELKDCGYTITPHLYKFEDYGIPQKRHRIIIVGIRNDLNIEFKVPKPSYVKKTAKEALSLPITSLNNEPSKQSSIVTERLSWIPEGKNVWWPILPEHLKLNTKGVKMSLMYKRLKADEPAYTVTGSGGGGTSMYHWSENRALTNRERARLQTFPDSFEFIGTKEEVRKQIGMAVPPDAAKIIFEAILKTMANIPYESIPSNIIVED